MKNILATLLIIGGFSLIAQNSFVVSGTVYDESYNQPIEGYNVSVSVYTMNDSTLLFNESAATNEAGYYIVDGTYNADIAFLDVGTYDCYDELITYRFVLTGDNQWLEQDFNICYGENDDCEAYFEYYIGDGLTVEFENLSEGDDLTYLWNFGDGNFSQEENPVHTYEDAGEYYVVLVIANGDSTCVEDYQEMVYVGGNQGDCEAYFEYYVGDGLTVEFENLSEGDDLTYLWNFGDGNFSQEENPAHTYEDAGEYYVVLVIANGDSTCVEDYQEMVYVGGNQGDCEAYFEYYIGDGLTVEFENHSEGDDLTYLWNFGDGNFSQEENPAHTYEDAGEYYVVLVIANGDSTCVEDYQEMVYVGGNQGDCEAYFEYYIGDGLTVEFENHSEGDELTYLWNFGDGNYSGEENPEHTYNASGIYEVCLMISSEDSTCFDVFCELIVIDDMSSCLAQFSYYPNDSLEALSYQFIDLSYGVIDSWYWDFGDGTYSVEQNPVHTFTEEGAYNICLTVSIGDYCESTWCEDVYIGPYVECFNYFTYEAAGNSVLFEGFHSNEGAVDYYWEFGDGTSGEGQVVSHTYESTGTYFVSLSTFEGDICSATSSQVIVVGDSIEYNQIYGQVFEGNFPLNEGIVMIFSMDTDSNYIPFFDISVIDSSGVYIFPFVPNGEFAVYAIPFYFNGYMPTYYGDVVNWEDATPVILGEPNNPYNINLVAADAPTDPGNGSIIGTISDPAVREGFIDKVTILLYNENYELIDFTDVNSEGSFNINDLAKGTYYIYPELTGVSSNFMRVDIRDEQQEVVVHMTMDGNSILGNKELFTVTEAGDIFPNPADRNARVELTNQKSTLITVQVLDITGRNHSIVEYTVNAGRSVIDIPMESLQIGLYIVKISNTEGNVITKKVLRQ